MSNKIIPYRSDLKELARVLRKSQTEAEKLLWDAIRRKKLGVEFHRQIPLLDFIVDFYCHELGFAIEVDGSIHDTQFLEDAHRAGQIEQYGIKILRFTNDQVFKDINSVIAAIKSEIEERS
ncbi:endonuclease domain-containing protein [Leeuwenhoekiella sp. H156]|uniref:endonuclease domain-containing protein n=1 Tax=Leeuwenhoekiella sp. H156 TaxID=3450128 RepID=UPI003FA477EF